MSWTDERVELLKKLWTDGLSASQIAAELGGVTRNAVIGKVHRLGLSGRAKPVSTKPRTRKPRATLHRKKSGGSSRPMSVGATALQAGEEPDPLTRAQPVAVEELVIPLHERADIMDLNDSVCRWPIGDPQQDDFHFCGRKAEVSGPYCEHHAKIAFQQGMNNQRNRKTG